MGTTGCVDMRGRPRSCCIGEDGIYQTGWELAIQPDDLQEHGAEFWDEPVIAPGPPWQYKLECDDGRVLYIDMRDFDRFLALTGEKPGIDFTTRLHQIQKHMGAELGRIIGWKEENAWCFSISVREEQISEARQVPSIS